MNLRHFTAPFFMFALASALPLGMTACGDDEGSIPPEPKYTLDNVCAQIAPEICAQRENCCVQGVGYDQTSCEAHQKAECDANVADVRAGKMTFDGGPIDACLAAVQPYADKCTLSYNDSLDLLEDFQVCSDVFVGQLEEDQVCERNAQCKPSSTDKEYVSCDQTTKKCAVIRLLPDGAACTLMPGTSEVCDQGLYCDGDVLTMGEGSCKPATPVNSPCDAAALVTLECGLGAYCDKTSGDCEVQKQGGEACAMHLECQTFTCEMATMKCTAPEPLFGEEACKGATTP